MYYKRYIREASVRIRLILSAHTHPFLSFFLLAPYIPPIDPSNASDTQNFDDTFLDMEPVIDDPNDQDQVDTDQDRDHTDGETADGEDAYPTPSHSRSPSVRPDESGVDVFDGYSFKGRHSVIVDEEDEDGSGDSGEEETDEEDIPSVLTDMLDSPAQPPLEAEVVTESPVNDAQLVEPEPKTPEARPQALLEEVSEPEKATVVVEPAPSADLSSTPRITDPLAPAAEPVESAPPLPAKDSKSKATKVPAFSKATVRNTRNRREKSGIPALDRFLSDGPDEDEDMTEKEDDDDWDFIEADGEDRNGTKGPSLFARGVVDRYRLAVFRKASTPSQRVSGRSVSGFSKESDLHGAEPADSPSPSEKRRGRTPGLKFRKTPQFLKGKSPPSSFSAKSSSTIKTSTPSNAATSTTISSVSSNGLLTPSVSAASTMAMSPSLRSKESAISVGNQSQSSDQSNGETAEPIPISYPASPEAPKYASHHSEEPEKLKSKKLKKYKENAEKVLSLFASQR